MRILINILNKIILIIYYFYKYYINYFYYINLFFNLNLNMNCNEINKQQSYSKKQILNFFFDSDKKILCKKSQKKTNFKNVSFKNKSEVNKKFSKLRSVNLEKTVSFSKKVIKIENKNSPSKNLISTKLKKAKEHIKTPYRDNFKKVIKSIDNLKSVDLFQKEKTAIKFNKKHLIDNIYSERKKGNENILNISSRSI